MNKEKVFNDYVLGVIDESELVERLGCIEQSYAKSHGVVYTPWSIMNLMLEVASPNPTMKIIEPSCGHGGFLLALIIHMEERFGLRGQKLLSWFRENVVGIEISKKTTLEARELLALFFSKRWNISVHPDCFSNIVAEDGLLVTFNYKFDLTIGNPPYISSKNLEADYLSFLKKSFASCQSGNVDTYFAFIERYADISDRVVFIVPNGFLFTQSGKRLRKIVGDKVHLLIDFKGEKVFSGVSPYTCIIHLDKSSESDSFLYGNEFNSVKLKLKKEWFKEKSSDSSLHPILTGIATLCDSLYLVKKKECGGFYATYEGAEYEVEKEILMPYLKLTKIRSQKDILNSDYMIFPYNEEGKVISEESLQKNYPKTYQYFLKLKPRLAMRDKGKTSNYEAWYAYGRKQGFHKIKAQEILIIPKMMGGECYPLIVRLPDIMRNYGRLLFTSGYIVPIDEGNREDCRRVLSPEFQSFLEENGKPWNGKDKTYYSLTVKQLKCFPVKDE